MGGNGVCRWVKQRSDVTTPKRRGATKGWLIHDNGGRPFKVVQASAKRVQPEGHRTYKNVQIFKEKDPDHDDDIPTIHDKLAKEYDNVEKVFVGKSSLGGARFDGNTILLRLSNNRYVYIGEGIYEFTPPEPIDMYYSLVGNSDVPYPVALSKSYVYFMLDGATYVDRSAFPPKTNWSDAYTFFYDGLDKKLRKKLKTKLVHKRIW